MIDQMSQAPTMLHGRGGWFQQEIRPTEHINASCLVRCLLLLMPCEKNKDDLLASQCDFQNSAVSSDEAHH